MTDISKAAVDVAANVLRITGEHYIASLLTALRAALDEAEARANDAETFLDNAISKAPEPLTSLGGWLANLLDEDDWPTAERYLNAAVVAAVKAEAERDAANALLRLADDALTEAEAILGGEYGDHYATLCETMIELRGKIAARAALKENNHE